ERSLLKREFRDDSRLAGCTFAPPDGGKATYACATLSTHERRQFAPKHCECAQSVAGRSWCGGKARERLDEKRRGKHRERTGPAEMLARKEDPAAAEIERAARGRTFGRPLAAMEGARFGEIDATPVARSRSLGKIEVLEVDEEALVEAAERREHRAADKEER